MHSPTSLPNLPSQPPPLTRLQFSSCSPITVSFMLTLTLSTMHSPTSPLSHTSPFPYPIPTLSSPPPPCASRLSPTFPLPYTRPPPPLSPMLFYLTSPTSPVLALSTTSNLCLNYKQSSNSSEDKIPVAYHRCWSLVG